MVLESIGFGLVILFMILGLIGAFVPLIPGALLVWISIGAYAMATKFSVISGGTFAVVTAIALVSATADLWLSLLGAKVSGASGRSVIWGSLGAVVGLIFFNLFGVLLGYAAGIILSEYRKHGNWHVAMKASLGGLVGWGLSTLVEAIGAIIMIAIFIWNVATRSG